MCDRREYESLVLHEHTGSLVVNGPEVSAMRLHQWCPIITSTTCVWQHARDGPWNAQSGVSLETPPILPLSRRRLLQRQMVQSTHVKNQIFKVGLNPQAEKSIRGVSCRVEKWTKLRAQSVALFDKSLFVFFLKRVLFIELLQKEMSPVLHFCQMHHFNWIKFSHRCSTHFIVIVPAEDLLLAFWVEQKLCPNWSRAVLSGRRILWQLLYLLQISVYPSNHWLRPTVLSSKDLEPKSREQLGWIDSEHYHRYYWFCSSAVCSKLQQRRNGIITFRSIHI